MRKVDRRKRKEPQAVSGKSMSLTTFCIIISAVALLLALLSTFLAPALSWLKKPVVTPVCQHCICYKGGGRCCDCRERRYTPLSYIAQSDDVPTHTYGPHSSSGREAGPESR